jgi:hypothetical protein
MIGIGAALGIGELLGIGQGLRSARTGSSRAAR